MKKKILSVFLAVVLSVTMVPTLSFADTAQAATTDTGELSVSMHRREALADTTFNVSLKSTSNSTTKTAQIKAAKDATLAEAFVDGIANGTYELTITAPNYLTYKQVIDFDGRCVTINLYNYQSANDGISGSAKLGVMPAGDMNSDGVINDADADLVKNAIQANNKTYDISGDGTVDLDDVAFVVRNAGTTVAATPLRTISSAVLKQATTVSNATETTIQGTASNLLSQTDGSVSLARKDSAKISAAKPVEINIQTNSSSEALQDASEAIVIAPPESNNSMSEGKVTVEGVDEQGKTVTIEAPVTAATTVSAQAASAQNALAAYDAEGAEGEEGAVEGEEPASEDAVSDTTDVDAVSEEPAQEPVQEPVQDVQQPAVTSEEPAAQEPAQDADVVDVVDNQADKSYTTQADEITVENDGTVVINLGTRVAIKKVTIRVTATANQGNLAEIAKVEFLSDFAERIPEPQLSIPTVTKVTNTNADGLGYKSITIQWTPEPNVTGYEVSVSGNGYNKTAQSTTTSYTFVGDSFNGTIKSFLTYDVKVRSINGDWRSEWSDVVKHEATCTNKPPAPQYLSVTPLVERLNVSWNCKFDAEWYTLYYREKNSTGDFAKIENITSSNYALAGLEPEEIYQVYVVAHNRNGDSPKSVIAEGRTLSSNLTRMPKFDLLNYNDQTGMATTGIKSIIGNSAKAYELRSPDKVVNQTKATYEDWKMILDNDPDTYFFINDWDSGVAYANFRGPIITLNERTDVDTFRIAPSDKVSDPGLYQATIRYKDYDKNGAYATMNTSISVKYDSDNHKYYEIIADNPINSDYFELRLRNFNSQPISIQELKIYKYNSLDNDIAAIFADEMRTMVKETVTLEQVQALIDRANTIDPSTGEYHPHRETQLAELNYALDIVKNGANEVNFVSVDNQITAKGEPASGMAQALSDYQPLGYVAGAGDTIVVYVTDQNNRTARGANANLNLICTQMHPEVVAWQKSVQLKAGRNEITIPQASSLAKERGGSLYLQYTGEKGYNDYTVRVLGASAIPVLNVTGVYGTERTAAIQKYVADLKTYVTTIQANHNKIHKISDTNTNTNINLDYAYNEQECILNYTDICMDNMMYSFPATQVNKALGATATAATRATKLENALAGMETQIDYFYQFKGLNKQATDNDRYPKLRLNVRYHKMFTGAFMYAAGKHIGIEWGSVAEPFSMSPVVADTKGQKTSGSMSGWGLAHEIGHCINAAAYQRVEVTNNVFAQIAKAASSGETSSAFRTSYESVYAGVVSGTMCHTGNLAVQLAQYWQLHLAYDNNYLFKTYSSISDQQRGLFYARMESYLRDRTKLPKAFIGNPTGDQVFMQAACAAANRDILDYFTAWGYKPDASTIQYASQFAKETRKIQYINDDARLWRIEGKDRMSTTTKVTAKITNATNSRINGNKVTISLANNNTIDGAMLGYEIKRDGKVVGFVSATATSFTDTLTTENNKSFNYEVTAYDKYLNATETVALDEVKVCHDGSISKVGWIADSNVSSKQDTYSEGSTNDPDAGAVEGTTTPGANKVSGAQYAIDDDTNTIFCGEGSTSNRPSVTINLGSTKQVTALKYTPAQLSTSANHTYSDTFTDAQMNQLRPFDYKIELSQDGSTWTTVKQGSMYKTGAKMTDASTWIPQSDIIVNNDSTVAQNKSVTIYFSQRDDYGNLLPYMNTYDASFIRFSATNMTAMAASEIDILGPTSDNVELVTQGYGTLASAFKYDANEDPIPAGSRILYGEYKGDPAYNIVILKDQNGNVIDGQSIIMADVAENGMLGETSDGRWIFWMENKSKVDANGDTYNELQEFASVTKVKAELYRVQDAMTLAGQRLTSTSLTMKVPTSKPNINLNTLPSVTSQTTTANASAAFSVCNNKAYDTDGNMIFDEAATVDEVELEATQEDTTETAKAIGPMIVDAGDANVVENNASTTVANEAVEVEQANKSEQAIQMQSIEQVEAATSDEVVNMLSSSTDTIDVNQASLESLSNGFAFKVNPSSIAIASEGVFTFSPALPANAKVDVKGLSNTTNANGTYNGSYYDAQGRLHVFVIARSGVIGNLAKAQNQISFTGTISGLTARVKGVVNEIRDIDGDYEEPTVTTVTQNAVDFFAYQATAAAKASITSVKISPTSYAYTKKAITPKLVVKSGATTLRAGVDYSVAYSGARKNVGSYKVTVTGTGSYTGTKTATFKIIPKGTTISKLTAKKKSMVVKIKKQATQTTGYKIRYSLKKTMKSAKTKTISKAKTTSATIKSLKSKKTYYVQVSTYKKIGKTVYQSAWSKAKKVKIK